MLTDKEKIELSQLIVEVLEGSITEDRIRKLKETLASDEEAVSFYSDFMRMHTNLRFPGRPAHKFNKQDAIPEPAKDDSLWQALAESERNAEVIEVERENVAVVEQREEMPPARSNELIGRRRSSRLLIVTALGTIAALLLILAYVYTHPKEIRHMVAVLADSINAKWSDSNSTLQPGEDMWVGNKSLLSGFVMIDFDDGATVIIEGPSEFELTSARSMVLKSGTLWAEVPLRATGFTVTTPDATIVDLGTEFGVHVTSFGSSEVHMIKGSASLIPGKSGHAKGSQILSAGSAKRVDSKTGGVTDVKLNDKAFVRQISSKDNFVWYGERTIDLSDIIRGGNGFGTGRPGYSLNVDTASVTRQRYFDNLRRLGPFGTKKVNSLPFVDCLFMPDGGQGPITVSTREDKFEGCPDTDGYSWGDILGSSHVLHDNSPGRPLGMSLNGMTYGTPEKPGIFMHGNLGITFDLDAIRSSMPGFDITRFTALCGISETVLKDPGFGADPEIFPLTDIWVLVDCQVRFGSEKMKVKSQPQTIDFEIARQDRFLTLIITDGGDSNGFDWGIFAEPFLHVEP
jgi:hypothetical protein